MACHCRPADEGRIGGGADRAHGPGAVAGAGVAIGLFFLVAGASELASRIARIIPPTDLFAEAGLFGDRYHCDPVAAVDSRVHIYPKRVLLAAFRSDSALGERFMAVLAHQIRALRSRLEERNIRSARERA